MTGRDRKTEFIATIQSKRERPQWIQQHKAAAANGAGEVQKTNKLALDPQYREFMKISQACTRRIRDCFEKLEKFTILARKKTVFDDGELNRLIGEIRADISESKKQLDDLQSRYMPKQRHSENIVTTLQQRLANMTSNFKSTLEMRSRSVQQQTARHELFAGPTSTYSNSPNSSLVQQNDNYNNNGIIDMSAGPSQYHHHQQQQQQQQQHLLMDDQQELAERADKMHLMESTIVELGAVFNQLANMVHAQGETITRIDMNISETAGNVESAHDALLRYFDSINSNRWLILKVFGILFFFFIIFVMFAT